MQQVELPEFDPARRYYPTEFATYYRSRRYWNSDTLAKLFWETATRSPEHEAVVGHDAVGEWERLTYGQQLDRIVATAARLRAKGVHPGDRVVVQLPNVTDFLSIVFGIFHMGAIPVFALPAHGHWELAHFLTQAQSTTLITPATFAGKDFQAVADRVREEHSDLRVLVVGAPDAVSEHNVWLDTKHSDGEEIPVDVRTPARVDPEQLAFLQLSGGTTGVPKLIPRTHADYLYSVRESAKISELDAESRMLVVLPISHNFTMSSPGILGAVWAGSTLVLAREPSASTGFGLIETERITIAALVPPLLMAWLAAKPGIDRDLSSLRILQVGGAKLNEEAARRVAPELGCRLQQVFGMAEGLVNYTRADDPEELVIGTQGRPICDDDDEILILDDEGKAVPEGHSGHLFVRGPYTIRGYVNGVSADSFTADGFYRTGDIVRRLPSGHLIVEGRDKDHINRGGEKISAEEVENHLLAYPGVLDAAVVAVPDDVWGERSCAFLLMRARPAHDGAKRQEFQAIRAFLRERGLPAFKVPDQVEFPAAFPTTGVGKISRKQLRNRLRDTLSLAE